MFSCSPHIQFWNFSTPNLNKTVKNQCLKHRQFPPHNPIHKKKSNPVNIHQAIHTTPPLCFIKKNSNRLKCLFYEKKIRNMLQLYFSDYILNIIFSLFFHIFSHQRKKHEKKNCSKWKIEKKKLKNNYNIRWNYIEKKKSIFIAIKNAIQLFSNHKNQ